MKLYLIENVDVANQYYQLLKLNSECAKLQWSRSIKNIPTDVTKSLETVQDYVESKLYENCNENTLVSELSSQEEDYMYSLFKKSETLKKRLGSGVVLAGEQANEVTNELSGIEELKKITDALNSGKNLIML